MSKQIVKKQSQENQLAHSIPEDLFSEAFGDVESKDLQIPYLIIAQKQSEVTEQDGVTVGGIYSSRTNETLTKPGDALQFIPAAPLILLKKERQEGSRFVTDSYEPWPKGIEPEYEEMIDGVLFRNIKVYKFYLHLREDLEEGRSMPTTLGFQKTSRDAGRKLLTYCVEERQKSVSRWLELTTKQVEKNGNKYYVLVLSPTTEEVPTEYQMIAAGTMKTVVELKKAGMIASKDEAQESSNDSSDEEIPF